MVAGAAEVEEAAVRPEVVAVAQVVVAAMAALSALYQSRSATDRSAHANWQAPHSLSSLSPAPASWPLAALAAPPAFQHVQSALAA